MYPEIRLIGMIQAMEEPIQGKPDRVLTVISSLRDGKTGSFRVRVPSRDAQGCSIGDEILVQGELDEVGAIQTLHGGMLRKLMPMMGQPEAKAGASIHPQPAPMTPRPSASPAPLAPAGPPATASPAKPAPTTAKPFAAQAHRSPFGGLFGTMKPQAPAPSQSARPSPAPASQPQASAPAHALTSKGFASARASAISATTTSSSAHARPAAVAAPRQAWDVDGQPVAQPPKPTARKPKSELAEYLQDEIPW